MTTQALLEVSDLVKHFAVGGGLLGRGEGACARSTV
jgi:hypothetical protein